VSFVIVLLPCVFFLIFFFFSFFLSISRMVNEQQNIINLNNKHVKLILSELYINTWFNFSKIFIKIQQKKIVWISKKKTSRWSTSWNDNTVVLSRVIMILLLTPFWPLTHSPSLTSDVENCIFHNLTGVFDRWMSKFKCFRRFFYNFRWRFLTIQRFFFAKQYIVFLLLLYVV
jgi:hypothetical protein